MKKKFEQRSVGEGREKKGRHILAKRKKYLNHLIELGGSPLLAQRLQHRVERDRLLPDKP